MSLNKAFTGFSDLGRLLANLSFIKINIVSNFIFSIFTDISKLRGRVRSIKKNRTDPVGYPSDSSPGPSYEFMVQRPLALFSAGRLFLALEASFPQIAERAPHASQNHGRVHIPT